MTESKTEEDPLVSHSPNWCGGEYHRPDCEYLPKRHIKNVKLSSIAHQMQDGVGRFPCAKCDAPIANGMKFCWKDVGDGVYHCKRKCPELKGKDVFVFPGEIDWDVWTYCGVCCPVEGKETELTIKDRIVKSTYTFNEEKFLDGQNQTLNISITLAGKGRCAFDMQAIKDALESVSCKITQY